MDDELRAEIRELIVGTVRDTVRELLAEQKPSSVEITRNASGTVQFTVKEYAALTGEALALAQATFRLAEAQFPYTGKK